MYKIDMRHIHKHKFAGIQPILELDIINHDVWLAGGSLQTLVNKGDVIYDYDIFFKDLWRAEHVKTMLVNKGFECIFSCPLGELFTFKRPSDGIKVQLITKFQYENVEQMLQSFDLQASMWGMDHQFVYTSRETISSTKHKRITFNKISYPIATLKRIFKYKDVKGYTIDNDALLSLVININTMDLDESNLIFYVD